MILQQSLPQRVRQSANVINKGDGSYTATYTAPALVDITAAVADQLTVMSMTLDESATASLTLKVPKTVVTVTISPSAEFSSVSSDMGAVSVDGSAGWDADHW